MKEGIALEQKILQTDRGPVTYWISWGSSDITLVFLHGLLGDHQSFVLSPYLDKFNILTWDGPAHGLSRPCSVFTYTYAAMDLRQILKKEQLSNIILIGQGFGSAVAQSYLRNSQALGLCMIDPMVFGCEISPGSCRKIWRSQWLCVCIPRSRLISGILQRSSLQENQLQRLEKAAAGYTKKELCRILTMGYVAFLKENREIPFSCPVTVLAKQPLPASVQPWLQDHHGSFVLHPDPLSQIPHAIETIIKKTV